MDTIAIGFVNSTFTYQTVGMACDSATQWQNGSHEVYEIATGRKCGTIDVWKTREGVKVLYLPTK
jgi:hypothetical protein